MKETFYFSHDYNATQDPKMMALLSSCGLSGIGMYWIIIEILHQQPDSKILYKSYEDYIEFYGRLDGENEHLLNNIKEVLINTGLFVKQDNFVLSERVLNNKKERERLSELRSMAGKKSAEVRQKGTLAEQVLNKGQQGKEIKGKESKENKYILTTNKLTLEEQIKPFINSYPPSMITDFTLYWDETDVKGTPRWKKEKTWNIDKRLLKWKRNQEKWDYDKAQKFIKVEEKPERKPEERTNSGFSKINFN